MTNLKLIKILPWLAVFAVLATAGLVPNKALAASCTAEQFHTANSNSQILYWFNVSETSNRATVDIQNNADCDATVSLAVYKMFESNHLDSQVYFDGMDGVVVPAHSSKTLSANLPTCAAQVDFYFGIAPHVISDSGAYYYPNVPFVIHWGFAHSANLCGNPPPPPPPPATLICSPASQNANTGDTVNFSATGGTGSYSWTGGGNPSTGNGAGFSTSFSTSGTRTVTVTSGAQTAQCGVTINQPQTTLVCSPANQTVNVNNIATFSATGGNGTYSWAASGGSPASGNGANFSSAYSTAGTKTVTVTSGTQTAQCGVTVNQPAQTLACSPSNQNINSGDIASFNATGGNGNYSWSGGGSPSAGNGANFSSAFTGSGARTVTVTDGSQTAQCSVNINQVQNLTCSPSTQTGNIGSILTFSASGGNGTYSWAGGGSPMTGSGANFATSFSNSGAQIVTVSSGGQTATCSATINQNSCTQPNAYVNAATNISQNSATLTGYVDPQGKVATYWFEYGTTNSYGYTSGQMTVSSAQSISVPIYNLQPNTTYYFRIVAQTSCGTAQSSALTFMTTGSSSGLSCNPQYQNANQGSIVNFNATGGNGTYSWSASNASPSYGTGSNFSASFNSPGTQIVTVSSGISAAQCSVNVGGSNYYSSANFQITKGVLNRTLGQNNFQNSTEAQSQDMVEFEIRIRNTGASAAQFTLSDYLPNGLAYLPGTTRIDGTLMNDTYGLQSIQIGTIYPGQEKSVRIMTTVNTGVNVNGVLTNQATATSNGNTQTATATVNIRPRGAVLGAGDIVTGPDDVLPMALTFGLLSSLALYYFLFMRSGAKFAFGRVASVLPAIVMPETKPEIKKKKTELEKLLENIRAEEKGGDL